MQVDKILIEGLECWARVGVPIKERRRRQKVMVDLTLGLDLRPAAKGDRLDKTINYFEAARQVKKLVEEKEFRLVETMVEETARFILEKFKPAEVQVRIRKFSVPGTKSVGVEVKRREHR